MKKVALVEQRTRTVKIFIRVRTVKKLIRLSCGTPFVKLQESAKALVADHRSVARYWIGGTAWKQQPIMLALVRPLMEVVMREVLHDGMKKGCFAEEDHLVEAFIFSGSVESPNPTSPTPGRLRRHRPEAM